MRRREFLAASLLPPAFAQTAPTRFQYACMTLPYSAHPMERALEGIKRAGYDYVAWGVNHKDAQGRTKPALAVDAPASDAAALARRCRDMGLDPVMMFSTVNLEAPAAFESNSSKNRSANSGS